MYVCMYVCMYDACVYVCLYVIHRVVWPCSLSAGMGSSWQGTARAVLADRQQSQVQKKIIGSHSTN
jgi:hypothetical protein